MIYLFAGDDTKNKRASYENFINSIDKEIEAFYFNKNNFDFFQVENFISSGNLFFSKSIIFFESISDKEEDFIFLLNKLDLMNNSHNDFVFLEGKIDKKTLDIFKKHRVELNIFELSKEKKEKYDNFLLANAFGDRNKLELWLHYRRATDLGVPAEELVGVLFWKAKDMLLKKNFYKFSEKELKNFSKKISFFLQEARKNGTDTEPAFEQFLLEAF